MALPNDPFDAPGLAELAGAAAARDARTAFDAGDHRAALELLGTAARAGIPAELRPHAALLRGLALLAIEDLDGAREALRVAWSEHPDVAVLPATLGAVEAIAGDGAAGSLTLFAALVSDDPDRSIELHRRRLTPLLARLRAVRDGG